MASILVYILAILGIIRFTVTSRSGVAEILTSFRRRFHFVLSCFETRACVAQPDPKVTYGAEDGFELLICFHTPSVEIKGVHRRSQFIQYLRSIPGSQAC